MDWLTFKFVVLIWVLCVSTSKSQPQLLNSTSSLSNQLRSACEDGQLIVPPDQCNSCICFAAQIYCTNIPCPAQDCVNGVDLPQPDACNKCICRRGKVACTNMICIPAPHCTEKKLYTSQNKCNACMCLNGFITCTNNPCAEEPLASTTPTSSLENQRQTASTTKKPKEKRECTEGDFLPGSNECMECFCQSGRKRCKYICNPTLESRFSQGPNCVSGQHIPRPDDCNRCICFEEQIHCTQLPCLMDTRIATTNKPKEKRECTEGDSLPGSNECMECFCQSGRKRCKYICNPILESRFSQGPNCVFGQHIPRPDDCNRCICFDEQIHCTQLPCLMDTRIATTKKPKEKRECTEGDSLPGSNECMECFCQSGRKRCKYICNPTLESRFNQGSNCVSGQDIPSPDECNHCICFQEQIYCTHLICRMDTRIGKEGSSTTEEVRTLDECQEGDIISPPPPPYDCNTCYCMDNRIICTMNSCEGSDPEINGRLSEPYKQSDIESFDKHVAVEPVINMLSKKYGKLLTKLIHTHAYNGFHQVVKVHTGHLPKDATELLKVLATLLDNAALASISQRFLTSSNSLSNNHVTKVPIDHQLVQTNLLDEGNVLTTQSSKLNTSGFQTNETILVIPNTVPFEGQNTQSVLPLTSKHETIWKPVSSPVSFVLKNNSKNNPRSSQEEKLKGHYYDNPPSMFTSIDQHDVIRKPSKFVSHPGFPLKLPSKPARNTEEKPNTNTQSIYPASNPKSINIKPVQIPFKPNQNHLTTLNNKGIQPPPLFSNNPNQPMLAANQYKKPQFRLKPGQGSVSPLNNKGNQTDQKFKAFPSNFQINPPLINLPYQKKRIFSIANEGSKEIPPHPMVQNCSAHHTNILDPPQIGVSPKYTQHKPSHSQFAPNPSIYYLNEYEAPETVEVNTDQEQLIPHPKTSYTHIENCMPGHDTLIPKVCNKTRKYNTTQSRYEEPITITYVSGYDPTHPANPHQITHEPNEHNNAPQTNVYQHYLPDQESQELDLTMSKVNYYLHLPNLQIDQYEPHSKLSHYYSSLITFFPGQQQNYTLKVHPTVTEMNKYNHHDSRKIKNHQFDTYSHSHSDGKNTDQMKSYQNRTNPTIPMYPNIFANKPHSSSESQFVPSQDSSKKGGLNDPKSADGSQSISTSNSAEDPSHSMSNKHLHPPLQTRPTRNQHPPGVFDDRGFTKGFQYAHNAEDPGQLIPVQKLLPSKLESPQHQPLPGFYDERGSGDSFQYPSNSVEDLSHPKVKLNKSPHFGPYTSIVNPEQPEDNLHISPRSQFGPAQNQNKPSHKLLHFRHSHTSFGPTLIQHSTGMFHERGPPDRLQHPSYSAEKPLHPKENVRKPPNFPFGPTTYKQLLGIYPSVSASNPTHPKSLKHPEQNKQKQPHLQVRPNHNKPTPGMFGGRGSPNGFQYSSNSPENSIHQKGNLHYPANSLLLQFRPPQNQYLPVFQNHGSNSVSGIQYPFNSVGNPTRLIDNLHNPSYSQFLPTHNQYTVGVLDDRGSAGKFQYPSNPAYSKENLHILPHSQFVPTQNQHTQTIHKQPNTPLGLPQNHHLPGMFGERGFAYRFQYPSNSAKNNPNTTPEFKIKLPQHQPKPSSLDNGYNNNNPLRPWMHVDHDQYKPSSFDNLLNGGHHFPWSFPGISFNNLFNGIHHIPWSVPNQDNNALGSDAEITTPRYGFKSKQDQNGPLMVKNPSISNENKNTDLTNVNYNQLQIEQDVSTPFTDLTDSVGIQCDLPSKLKSDSDPDSLFPTDDGKIPDNYDQLYPLLKAVKKLSDPPVDDSVLSVGNMDQLDLFHFLFPGISKILNYGQPQDQEDVAPVENHDVKTINPLSKLKSKLKQLFENNNGILNGIKSKLNKLVPTKENTTVIKNDIDMTKVLHYLSELTPSYYKHTVAVQTIPYSGSDPEIIENIMNDFKEDTLTTTSSPRTDSTHSYENRTRSVPIMPEESRLQEHQLEYPDVHIILHQPNDGDDVDLPPYISINGGKSVSTNGEINLDAKKKFEELSAFMFPKMFNTRFRHRPTDQKEECGHGTQWISYCHSCSCYFGQAMCFRLPNCELRPLGEPMTCKPYSHFKMGCYTCECNGDGVAGCDATDCNTEVSGSTESLLRIFNDEYFDSKKTNPILKYYNSYKKLPKDCPKQDLQTQYSTCERGTSWVSSCHKCECNESGKHECIKIADCELDVDAYGKPGRCKPNSKFYPKTNSMPCVECSCNDEGISCCPAPDYKKQ